MLRKNRGKLLLSCAVTLLPCLIGLALWPQLPDEMPIHFGPTGMTDGWAGKALAVFGFPLSLLAAHLICIFCTLNDPKRENIGKKPLALLFWLIPATSLIVNVCLYAYALNMQINMATICTFLMGLIFLVTGNILPKLQQNYTFGIKVSWALDDPENWAATHRMGGWCWAVTGVLLLTTGFWLPVWLMLVLLTLAVAAPIVYSYVYYRQHSGQR